MSSQTVENIKKEIKNRIIFAFYEPGYILSEGNIAGEFLVSRTPVREALQNLQQEGWLKSIAGVGSQVAMLDFTELGAFFEIKKALEALAARMACKKIAPLQLLRLSELAGKLRMSQSQTEITEADEAFHQVVWETAGNPLLQNYLQGLHERLERYWQALPEMQPDMDVLVESLHRLICAFKSGNEEEAARQAVMHVDSYINKIKDRLF